MVSHNPAAPRNFYKMKIRMFLMLAALFAGSSVMLNAQSDRHVSISTNAVNWLALGTVNANVSIALDRHFSLGAGGRYNPWTYGSGDSAKQMQMRERTANVALRYWPWFVYSGWWFDAGIQYQEYNKGGVVSRLTEEGDAYGLSLGLGYTHMLNPRINLEFGLWMWGGYKKYATYVCPLCGRKLDEGAKGFFAPDNVALSIIYLF